MNIKVISTSIVLAIAAIGAGNVQAGSRNAAPTNSVDKAVSAKSTSWLSRLLKESRTSSSPLGKAQSATSQADTCDTTLPSQYRHCEVMLPKPPPPPPGSQPCVGRECPMPDPEGDM
jgi:hypothetical protein